MDKVTMIYILNNTWLFEEMNHAICCYVDISDEYRSERRAKERPVIELFSYI